MGVHNIKNNWLFYFIKINTYNDTSTAFIGVKWIMNKTLGDKEKMDMWEFELCCPRG